MATSYAPTTQDLERSIRAYVAAGSGLASSQVIPGYADGPAPNGLYASVLLINEAIQGIPGTIFNLSESGQGLKAPVRATVRATVRASYSVQWFREGSRDAARRFSVWASSPAGRELAAARGLTFLSVSDVRQLDDIVSDAWEERAGLDLEIGYIQKIHQALDYIEAAPVHVREGEHIQIVEV